MKRPQIIDRARVTLASTSCAWRWRRRIWGLSRARCRSGAVLVQGGGGGGAGVQLPDFASRPQRPCRDGGDPSAAAQSVQNYRLPGSTLYVHPGTLQHVRRFDRACADRPRGVRRQRAACGGGDQSGAVLRSGFFSTTACRWRGLLAEESGALLAFFQARRAW